MGLVISVDTGGTHTDAFAALDGRYATGKAQTTRYNLSVGFFEAVQEAVGKLGLDLPTALRQAEAVKYSTTVGTNVLIERNGPKLGLITTWGFEETIHIGRAHNWADGLPRAAVVDRARAKRPEPLIPRELRVGIRERMDYAGHVIMPLDLDEVREKVQYLVDQGVRGFVVSLLWSFANPRHEEQIREVIRAEYPEVYLGNMPVLLSSEVSPKIKEYQRTITTILEGYMRSSAEEHFLDLTEELRDRGFTKPLMVARNTGGVASVGRTRPLNLYGAGPVAGIAGGRFWGEVYGRPNVLITDMGGTSFDIGLVVEGQERTYEFNPIIDRWKLNLPVIASYSIGAGGGSIARVDEFGRLHVGPASAGSMPGPACYDKGGTEATVTDADLVLGYLNPDFFLGGKQKLNRRRAVQAIRHKVAGPLGIAVEEAALRIRNMVDAFMGQEIHKEVALRGFDPHDFMALAFGGAGPTHCCGYVEAAEIDRILTFPFGSAFNAFGASTMGLQQTYEKTRRIPLYERNQYTAAYADFNAIVADLQGTAVRDLREDGIDIAQAQLTLELDAIYAQQTHSTRFASPRLTLAGADDVAAVCDAFNQSYGAAYGKGSIFPQGGIVVTGFVLTAAVPAGRQHFTPGQPASGDAGQALRGRRDCMWSVAGGFEPTPVYDGLLLGIGHSVTGPGLVETPHTTYVIKPGWRCTIDEFGGGLIEKVRG